MTEFFRRQDQDALLQVERDALRMVYFGGFTYGQAAEMLDVPLGTLKSRLRGPAEECMALSCVRGGLAFDI